jgi:hypothetical protein
MKGIVRAASASSPGSLHPSPSPLPLPLPLPQVAASINYHMKREKNFMIARNIIWITKSLLISKYLHGRGVRFH